MLGQIITNLLEVLFQYPSGNCFKLSVTSVYLAMSSVTVAEKELMPRLMYSYLRLEGCRS